VAKIIPNQNSWIGFTATAPAGYSSSAAIAGSGVTVTELELDASTNLTPFVVSLTASAQGNTVPIPSLDSTFDRSIYGTTQATFQGDFYRDTTADTAWTTLTRGTSGYMLVSRFGGTGTNKVPRAGQTVEVWPIQITQRAGSQLTSNQAQTFTVNAAVFDPAAESAAVTASTGVPSTPLNFAATKEANGIAVLDWNVPVFLGTGGLNATTPYKVYQSAAGAAQSTIATGGTALTVGTGFTLSGTTARISTGLTTGQTYWFGLEAVNNAGTSGARVFASVTV
jgi:hypothetical protein